MKFWTSLVAITLVFSIVGQTYQLIDKDSKTSIPFAKIYPNIGNPSLADLDGFFTVNEGVIDVKITAHGYRDTLVQVNSIKDFKITLSVLANELEEVTIIPGINPAERIMELAIANRKLNHPYGKETFSYDSYSKFIFTIDPASLDSVPMRANDTLLQQIKELFSKQHLFLIESTSKKMFEPPYREKEVITAYKVSGFSNPLFSTFTAELQSFHFYENQFNILGKSYLNPLAFGGIRRYLFILEDQTINGKDTTFTIRFQPRKDKNFDGMKGWLYINSNGYALEKVIAQPDEATDGPATQIIQEYAFIDGKKWFPIKLATEATFSNVNISSDGKYKTPILGKGTTYIDNIQLGTDLKDEKFNSITLETADDAADKDTVHWNANRKYRLTEQEKLTYVTIDSISKAEKLDRLLNLSLSLVSGKIPLGYLQMDLKRLIYYRNYEGYRLGLGLETSPKLSKRGMIGGYFGYGTRDKAWKYGGYGNWKVFKKKLLFFNASYQEDIISRGWFEPQLSGSGLQLDGLYKHLYVRSMDKQRKAMIGFSGYVRPRVYVFLGMDYQRLKFTEGYQFTMKDGTFFTGNKRLELAEVVLELKWSLGAKMMQLGDQRIVNSSKFPIVSLKVANGIPGIGDASLEYVRTEVKIEQTAKIRGVGKLNYSVLGTKTVGDVPLLLQNSVLGTGGNWNLSVANSFETMFPTAFYTDQMIACFTRFSFNAMKSKFKWTAPQLVLHHALGTGSMDRTAAHNILFQTMNKGYYEGGVLIKNILKSGASGIGIGTFYVYGPYSNIDARKNFTFKIALTTALD